MGIPGNAIIQFGAILARTAVTFALSIPCSFLSFLFKYMFLSPALPSISVVFLSGWRGFRDTLSQSIYHIKYQPSSPLLFSRSLSLISHPSSIPLQVPISLSFLTTGICPLIPPMTPSLSLPLYFSHVHVCFLSFSCNLRDHFG